MKKGENGNHPKKGSRIKVDPIRDKKAIKRIKTLIDKNPYHYCFFVLGINTGLRVGELLSIKAAQVAHLKPGDDFEVFQTKTSKYRRVTINKPVHEAIQRLIKERKRESEYLFPGIGNRDRLAVPTASLLVKKWCQDAGLQGNFASHTLRKTWGYWQRVERKTALPILMEAFGHHTQRQTLDYLGIQDEEIQDIYKELEL